MAILDTDNANLTDKIVRYFCWTQLDPLKTCSSEGILFVPESVDFSELEKQIPVGVPIVQSANVSESFFLSFFCKGKFNFVWEYFEKVINSVNYRGNAAFMALVHDRIVPIDPVQPLPLTVDLIVKFWHWTLSCPDANEHSKNLILLLPMVEVDLEELSDRLPTIPIVKSPQTFLSLIEQDEDFWEYFEDFQEWEGNQLFQFFLAERKAYALY